MIPPPQSFKIVIDPGHGGQDEGTVYHKGPLRIAEKDITLALGIEVALQLKKKGYQVTLTRQRDQELPLPDRTSMANRIQADVFLSIHMNSAANSGSGTAEGVETYILNNTTDATSRRLARMENSVISTAAPHSARDQEVALILKDLRLDGNLLESKRLACQVQSQIVQATSVVRSIPQRNRGVKQALFHVLLGADMPSILIEPGFLNNRFDRSMVLSDHGRKLISRAIANGVDLFRKNQKPVRKFSGCKVN